MPDLREMPSAAGDPIQMLHACHRELRQALQSVETAAASEQRNPLTDAERETLRQTLRYLHTAVARHAADETESLFPRLRIALAGRAPSLLLSLRTVEWGHTVAGAAHWLLEDLGSQLVRTARFGSPDERARLARLLGVLGVLYQEHICLEEEEVLPVAARELDAGQLEAIGKEMAARRRRDG